MIGPYRPSAYCVVCPIRRFRVGSFDVEDRPKSSTRFDPETGSRTIPESGVPVCVHPYRVGLPPGRYASAGEPLPAPNTPSPEPTPEALKLPADLIDLEGWLVATLRGVDQDRIFGAVARAEREAAQRFAPGEVVTALRRVLSVELARRWLAATIRSSFASKSISWRRPWPWMPPKS